VSATIEVKAAQEKGRIIAGDPKAIAEVIWALVHGISTLAAAGRLGTSGTSVDEVVAMGARTVRDGLRVR